MEIVVEQVLILTQAFNYRLVGYVWCSLFNLLFAHATIKPNQII